MSYDIHIRNKKTHRVVNLCDSSYPEISVTSFKDYGGTYQLGDKTELSTNITYNYYPFFKKVFGEEGIRSLYGIKFSLAAKRLDKAIKKLEKADENSKEWTYKYPKHTEEEKARFLKTTGIPLEEPQGYWRCTVPNVLRALKQLKFLMDCAKEMNPKGCDADFEIFGD